MKLKLWQTAPGWEYDLLRTLPAEVAAVVFRRACRRWREHAPPVRRGRLLAVSCANGAAVLYAHALGWGAPAVLAELALHAAALYSYRQWAARAMKPFVADEMLVYIEWRAAQEHPL